VRVFSFRDAPLSVGFALLLENVARTQVNGATSGRALIKHSSGWPLDLRVSERRRPAGDNWLPLGVDHAVMVSELLAAQRPGKMALTPSWVDSGPESS
jgi:hypothetical protein